MVGPLWLYRFFLSYEAMLLRLSRADCDLPDFLERFRYETLEAAAKESRAGEVRGGKRDRNGGHGKKCAFSEFRSCVFYVLHCCSVHFLFWTKSVASCSGYQLHECHLMCGLCWWCEDDPDFGTGEGRCQSEGERLGVLGIFRWSDSSHGGWEVKMLGRKCWEESEQVKRHFRFYICNHL